MTPLAAFALMALGAWEDALGPEPVRAAFDRLAPKELERTPSLEKMTELAQACPALVNAFVLSGEERYRKGAGATADFLIAHMVKGSVPGWGPKLDKGYGFCPDHDDFTGTNLWDTTRALDCLLAYSTVAPEPARYVEVARAVADHWPAEARDGMRFFSKNGEACARRYVKNTNIAMAEVLVRLGKRTGEKRYQAWADEAIQAERWEILAQRNFGYHGAMIYLAPDDPQNKLTLSHERPKVEKDAFGNIVCRRTHPDPACWNHLGFEVFALHQVETLSGVDQSEPIARIMAVYRSSPLGDASRFDWSSDASPSHVTAYNCALRNRPEPAYLEECLRALVHRPSSALIFYALIPDWLAKR